MKRILMILGLGFVVALPSLSGCGSGGGGNGSGPTGKPITQAKRLNGGGSSFVDPMMQKWAAAYVQLKGVEVDYTSSGSTDGITKMIEKKNDFGCTDAPMNDEQLQKAQAAGGDVIHVPLIMGGVVPLYNLEGVDQELRFTGPMLADIYLGRIKRWNEAPLVKLNPGVNLPDKEIVPVYRADGSGTTYIFSDYLSKVSKEWAGGPGRGTQLKWPVGVGAQKSDGMAGQVTRTPGAIGYVELLYALRNQIKYGSVQNKEGEFVKASLESVTAAAENALTDIREDLRFSITDAPGKASYPISGTTWAVFYAKPPPPKAAPLADFFSWVTHPEGQALTAPLHYASLPKGLVERVEKKLESVKAAGRE